MLNVYALERQIEAQMRAAYVPGLALAAVRGQEVVYARGFGVSSVEEGGGPVTPYTLFRAGSVTKPLTGTAIMRLVDAGQLEVDAPVRRYLPWFTLSEPGAAERVTLRMLLTHTSGLPHDHRPFGRRDPEALAARIREEVPRYPLGAPPGVRYGYSNTGIHVLAHVAEVVTGQPYPDLMDGLVFRPLEMRRTTFDPTVAMTYPLAQSHAFENGALRVEHRFADNAANYASGQAISNVLELANFAVVHLNQGRFRDTQFLSAAAVAEMHVRHVDRPPPGDGAATPGGPHGYGLTFGVGTYKGLRRVGHAGAITNFGARLALLPDAPAAVVALFNRLAADFAIDAIVDRVLDELLDLPPGPAEAPQ